MNSYITRILYNSQTKQQLILINYPIISIKILNKFFKNYMDITGDYDALITIPYWFFFEGPQNHWNTIQDFNDNCAFVIDLNHYNKMKLLYSDILEYNSNKVLKTCEKAREIYNKIFDWNYWFSLN